MALTLPRLDDRTWDDLVEEARLLIPTYAPNWTNHNVSDPGITLIELLAYFCEILLYRLDQIGETNVRAFLKLINGPDWQGSDDIERDTQQILSELRRPHRAITAEDFEALALAANERLGPDAPARVARTKCLPRRDLEKGSLQARAADAPGHVSVIIVPEPIDAETGPLLEAVRRTLDPARLIATRVHVVSLPHVVVGARISLVAGRNALPSAVRGDAVRALTEFLHPLKGGPEGQGWPFGRSVYVSEIYQLLAGVPNVKSVQKLLHPQTGKPQDELVVRSPHPNRLRYNRLGELEGIELQAHELATFGLKDEEITVMSAGRTQGAYTREESQ